MSSRSVKNIAERIEALTTAAMRFVPPDRPEVTFRKWFDRAHVMALRPARQAVVIADAFALAADLLVSHRPAAPPRSERRVQGGSGGGGTV